MERVPFCFYILLLYSFGLVACDDIYNGLILTPFIRNGSCDVARSLSKVDPDNFLGVNSHSGFLTVKDLYNSNIFFWYFPHEEAAERPWIVWLQGGPGCSSLLGLFGGVGPLKMQHGEVKLREGTWADDYSLLFVDNPVGAGFSYTRDERGYTIGEDGVGEDLLEFLLQFLEVFPELREMPLFIAGESYAGKYVPTMGYYIHKVKEEGEKINLKGISIGNGLIDPRNQLGYSELCRVLGLVGDSEVLKLQEMEQEAIKFIDEGKMIEAANKFNRTIVFIQKKSGVNIYNLNKDPSSGAPAFEEFVNRPDVREWIHVGRTPYIFNNQYVYNKMLRDIMNTTRPFVEELLEHYGVLMYSGQLDVILSHALLKKVLANLQWSQKADFDNAPTMRVRNSTDKTVMAYSKSGGNLVNLVIRKSGHMVPKEQPQVFRYVLNTFIDLYK